ncbi:hypothetical protein ALP02_200163 [Pseudomonas coronafaciens pv. garcae]|nr:hypothetical protein ALP02_200163 [Pseudomonas coronafaciens pv. garcae]
MRLVGTTTRIPPVGQRIDDYHVRLHPSRLTGVGASEKGTSRGPGSNGTANRLKEPQDSPALTVIRSILSPKEGRSTFKDPSMTVSFLRKSSVVNACAWLVFRLRILIIYR